MNDNVVLRNAEGLRDQFPTGLRILRGRPDFQLAVMEMGRAVLRLKVGVR